MKRFRFSLRPVAILRAHHELRAQEAFAASVHAFVKSEQALAAARDRVQRMAAELTRRREHPFPASEEAQAIAAYRDECAAEVEAEKAVKAARDAMQQRRVEYIEAHRKMEVVKRLEQKARATHQHELVREEQAEFDDYASQRFVRRSLKSA